MVQAGERQGPCANPGCKKPEGTRLAQWTRIPESFQGWDDLADGHNGCVCRGIDCRDFVGLPPLSGQRKRPALAEGTAVQPAVPRPQFVLSPVALCACARVPDLTLTHKSRIRAPHSRTVNLGLQGQR